jgi:deoxyribodipyrimidine photo-lyase
MKTALWWIRRDLRVQDNRALAAALAHADCVVPVFVLDPCLLDSADVGKARVAFLLDGLRHLDRSLRARDSRLILRKGNPVQELSSLMADCDASSIFAEEDYSPYSRARDSAVMQCLPLHHAGSCVVRPPGTVLKPNGTPYLVFTAFSRRWQEISLSRTGESLKAPESLGGPSGAASLPIPQEPSLPSSIPFPAGESEALCRLDTFVSGDDPPIASYADTRDRLDIQGTSQLSPYMHLGMLSAHQAVAAAVMSASRAATSQARKGAQTWLKELIWREFFVHILYHFPDVLRESYRGKLSNLRWENDEADFAAWCEGRTGYPVVDAGMRQLNATGWMPNRARMITASFLVKDLLVDWRWGEQVFARCLVDGDRAVNNGNWQWVAGTGADAAPYFRIFNPVLQGKRHDPHGLYLRAWLPELSRVPDHFLHEPWRMPSVLQQEVGCVLGLDYPHPIVDHRWARERALAAYAEAGRTP